MMSRRRPLLPPIADIERSRHWTEGCGRDIAMAAARAIVAAKSSSLSVASRGFLKYIAKVPTIFPDEVSTGNDQQAR